MKKTCMYDDIINHSRPVSGKRARMSNYERAAQFSPFAALTGFDAAIAETGRLTDMRIELDEEEKQQLDKQMHRVLEKLEDQPKVTVRWFCADARKAGGAYVSTTGNVKKVDTYIGRLLLTDGRMIPLDEIMQITLETETGR